MSPQIKSWKPFDPNKNFEQRGGTHFFRETEERNARNMKSSCINPSQKHQDLKANVQHISEHFYSIGEGYRTHNSSRHRKKGMLIEIKQDQQKTNIEWSWTSFLCFLINCLTEAQKAREKCHPITLEHISMNLRRRLQQRSYLF